MTLNRNEAALAAFLADDDGRPTAVDSYCCEGGVSIGLDRAGFRVFGVDLFKHLDPRGRRVGFSQRRYPFASWQGDAIAFLAEHGQKFDLRTASPPCQRHSAGTRAVDRSAYPDLIGPTREVLREIGGPYVIENVSGAPLHGAVLLCWSMFDRPPVFDTSAGVLVRMERHRAFESNVALLAPGSCRHDTSVQVAGSYGGAQRTIDGARRRGGGYVPPAAVQARLLGVDHMTEGGMHQCIPPFYAEHLGRQLHERITR